MKLKFKNVLFFVCALAFSLFNIYKSIGFSYPSAIFSPILTLPWQRDNNINPLFNKSRFEALFQANHVPLKTKLSELGRLHNQSEYTPRDIIVKNQKRQLPFWQLNLLERSLAAPKEQDLFGDDIEEYYFLVVVLQVRIYSYDKARWTINELKQWMHYLLLAGVDHFLICDHYVFSYEKIRHFISKYIRHGIVTYLEWNGIRNPMDSQVKCYQRFIKRYRKYHLWHMAIDIDEYPFSQTDMMENFLVRYLEQLTDDVSEASMANFLMLGRGDRSGDMVVRRINRMTKQAANLLSKPIYRPERVAHAAVHHNHIAVGRRMEALHGRLKLLHYWGGRDQGWGEDTKKTLEITEEMNLMRDVWASKIKNSLLTFGEFEALTNLTGL